MRKFFRLTASRRRRRKPAEFAYACGSPLNDLCQYHSDNVLQRKRHPALRKRFTRRADAQPLASVAFRSAKVESQPRYFRGAKGDTGRAAAIAKCRSRMASSSRNFSANGKDASLDLIRFLLSSTAFNSNNVMTDTSFETSPTFLSAQTVRATD